MLFDTGLMAKEKEMLWEPALLDRSGSFHSLEGYKLIQPLAIPKPLDFETLCHERAMEIIATGKKINLLWSGGADSSLVLMLLHEHEAKEQLRVLTSTDSLKINPQLAKRVMANYEMDSPRLHDNGLRHYMDNQQLILSGIGMDMLTGCGFDVTESGCETLSELTRWLKEITGSQASDDEYQAFYKVLGEISDYPCQTIPEYSWLKNMYLCWQPELLQIGRLAGFGVYGEHYLNFYQTSDFESWSRAQSPNQLCEVDSYGNKKTASGLLSTLDKQSVPKRLCRQNMSMVNLFKTQNVTKISDDWQYLTDEPPT